ncbi:MAG TPA: RRXRR domain-containing protein [Chloroflexota bacterium]|nr:RRXRR domain-containing protein [Chloroflexota bacterium]
MVPVVSATGKPLMPTTHRRANRLLAKGRALRRFDRGLFYIKLLDRTDGYTQPVALGIDPGSKREAFVVQSRQHTLLNIQAEAVTWVAAAVKRRAVARHLRRLRKTPRRARRPNRRADKKRLPPSTRARWGLKVRLAQWLARYYPLTTIVIEDIKAPTRAGERRWNKSFSPLEVGKAWGYGELEKIAPVHKVPGYVTKTLRDAAGLHKSGAKLSDRWDTHCVDAFVLANSAAEGPAQPTSTQMLVIVPLQLHRRQLHRFNLGTGGRPKPYGGTVSLGLKRGSWVRHTRHGLVFVGGTSHGRISLHSMATGKRLTQQARVEDCQLLCTASWRIRAGLKLAKAGALVPRLKTVDFRP